MSDLKGGAAGQWVVCGWFTDDPTYRPLAEQLAASLDAAGAPYDLIAVSKLTGGWESNTLAKAGQALAALNRHPGKTIIFIDVDHIAKGDVSWLAQSPGDVAMQMVARRRRNGSARLAPSAQVMVFKPNEAARRFIEAWISFGREAAPGDTSEAFLTLARTVPDVSISSLDTVKLADALSHSWASHHGARRMSGWQREMANIFRSFMRRRELRTVTRG